MIDVKLLTLLKVHETGNYTRAAEQLSLTQPAVSQHIKQIEKELGISLFVRSGGKIRPTADGKLVIEYAERVVSLYENLQQALRDQQRSVDRLRVGITHTSESNVVTEGLAKYAEQNENLSITIQTDTISNLYAMLKNYKIDIAIVEGAVQDASINSIMLDTDFLVCAVSNENPLARKSIVTLDELKRERLILRLPSSGTRNLFAAHLESRPGGGQHRHHQGSDPPQLRRVDPAPQRLHGRAQEGQDDRAAHRKPQHDPRDEHTLPQELPPRGYIAGYREDLQRFGALL